MQRFQGVRQFNTTGFGFLTERWFIITGVVAIVGLTAALIFVSYRRGNQERKVNEQAFGDYAQKMGLSNYEQQVLLGISGRSGLRRSESIFTLGSAFDRGASRMIKESTASQSIEEPWGSKSARATLAPSSANQVAILVARVVFPQPPLAFISMIVRILSSPRFSLSCC